MEGWTRLSALRTPRKGSVRSCTGLCSGFWRGLGVRRRGDRQRLMHPIHQSEPAHVARTGQVTVRARQGADWAAFFRDGMLQEIGAEMQDFQSTSVYHSANLEPPAPLVDALQSAAFVEALDQSGDSHRDAVAIRGHRGCGLVRGVDV